MTVASTLELLNAAFAGGYAVAAFNILDDVSVRGVIDAAEKAQSPVIVKMSVKTVKIVGALALRNSVHDRVVEGLSVALHLDDCPDRAVISERLRLGWNSVLFDASTLSLDEARKQTIQVVAEAHDAGAHVESEIENIRGVEDGDQTTKGDVTHSTSSCRSSRRPAPISLRRRSARPTGPTEVGRPSTRNA